MNHLLTNRADPTATSPFSHVDSQYRMVFDAVIDGVFITDPVTGRFSDVNQSGCQMFGYVKDDIIGRDIEMLSSGVPPYTQEVAIEKSQRAYSGEVLTFEWQCKTSNDVLFWAEISLRYTEFGPTPTIVANVRDITERREQNERFRQLAENVAETFWMTNLEMTETLYVSPGYEGITGRSCQSLYENPARWFEAIHEDDRARVMEMMSRQAHRYEFEYRIVRPDGDVRWIADRAFPVRDDNGRIYRIAGIARDITERKTLSAQLEHMASHDTLTGLANRSMFTTVLDQAIAESRLTGETFAVLLLDLDHFKDVNDTRGHAVGDRLLQAVAERLQAGVRANEKVFRLGGDEFGILPGKTCDQAELGALADRLIGSISRPIAIDGFEVRVGASIGIAICTMGTGDADTLTSHADVALYRAKAEGRQIYRLYSPAMTEAIQARITLTDELRLAISRRQLFLAYQPLVTIKSGRILGVEALVRWRHPSRGILAPACFLSVAESSGLIVELDRWVLREACRQGREWIDAGISPGKVCVNLSSAQFEQPLAFERFVLDVLDETGLPAKALELEITESTFIGFSEQHRSMIQRLRSAGIRFSLDDFGTGFSSLNYLRRFSVDRIKIAQEFIADVAVSRDAAAIVKCILSLARDLGNGVVAEGVETVEQLKLLQDWDCPDVQGFYFAEPMTAEAVAPLLSAGAICPIGPN